MLDFYRTRAGRIFFEVTLPEIATQARRAATALTAICGPLKRIADAMEASARTPKGDDR